MVSCTLLSTAERRSRGERHFYATRVSLRTIELSIALMFGAFGTVTLLGQVELSALNSTELTVRINSDSSIIKIIHIKIDNRGC